MELSFCCRSHLIYSFKVHDKMTWTTDKITLIRIQFNYALCYCILWGRAINLKTKQLKRLTWLPRIFSVIVCSASHEQHIAPWTTTRTLINICPKWELPCLKLIKLAMSTPPATSAPEVNTQISNNSEGNHKKDPSPITKPKQ